MARQLVPPREQFLLSSDVLGIFQPTEAVRAPYLVRGLAVDSWSGNTTVHVWKTPLITPGIPECDIFQ
jgi:hypothetical protein